MCSEMDFTKEKSFSSNYKNSQLLLTAAAVLSLNRGISRGVKGIKNAFFCVLSTIESYTIEKNWSKF